MIFSYAKNKNEITSKIINSLLIYFVLNIQKIQRKKKNNYLFGFTNNY